MPQFIVVVVNVVLALLLVALRVRAIALVASNL